MQIPNEIIVFLNSVEDISLGYSEIIFSTVENIEDDQIGYSVDPDGNTLIKGNDGDWYKEWIVIATDHLGDPIIVDTFLPTFPVLSAIHGEGRWEPILIADSLETFKKIMELIKLVSRKRTTPVEIEKNSIGKKELNDIINEILMLTTKSDVSYWKVFLENDD